MSASKTQEAYIRDLVTRRNNDIYHLQATRNISKLTKQYNHFSNVFGRNMRNNNAPASAIYEHNRNVAKDFNEMSYNAIAEAGINDIARKEQYDEQISQAEYVKKEMKRQEKEQKDQEKKQLIAAGLKILGTGAGALLSGGNPMVGAMVGSGIGGMIGGAYSKDYQMILENLGTTIGGFAHASQLKEIKDTSTSLNQFMPYIHTLTEHEIWTLFYNYQNKNIEGINAMYKGGNWAERDKLMKQKLLQQLQEQTNE